MYSGGRTLRTVVGVTIDLPDGFELRRCTSADVDAVADLHTRRTGPVDGADFRSVATDPDGGPGWAAAVFERGRAVSAAMLLDEIVRVDDIELPAGQIELVATDEGYEGRGFVRSLMAWATDTRSVPCDQRVSMV